MASGTYAPDPAFTGFDNNGDPLNAGKLYTYAAGSSTPLATYSDVSLDPAFQNANPVILDSAGRCTLFLSPTSYKFILKDSADNTIWTRDNISAVPTTNVNLDIDGVAGEAISAGNVVYLSDGSGGNTAGRWYKADADFTYASTTPAIGMAPAAISSGASGSIRMQGIITGLSALVAGTTYYVSATAGALTSTAPANSRAVGQADTTTSLVIFVNNQAASATQGGIITLGTQTFGTGTKSVDKLTYKPGGVTTFDANASGRILGPYVTSQATSGVNETSCIATPPTIKANTLNASGDTLRATYVGIASADAQSTTFKIKLGGTTESTFNWTPNATALSWRLIVEITRTSAANAQQITSTLYSAEGTATASHAMFVDSVTGAKDLSTDLTFDVTMQRTVAGSVTFKAAFFEVIGA